MCTWSLLYLAVVFGFLAFATSGAAVYGEAQQVLTWPLLVGVVLLAMGFDFMFGRLSSLFPGWAAVSKGGLFFNAYTDPLQLRVRPEADLELGLLPRPAAVDHPYAPIPYAHQNGPTGGAAGPDVGALLVQVLAERGYVVAAAPSATPSSGGDALAASANDAGPADGQQELQQLHTPCDDWDYVPAAGLCRLQDLAALSSAASGAD